MFYKKYKILITHSSGGRENEPIIPFKKQRRLNYLTALYAKYWICRYYKRNGCAVSIVDA